MIKGSKIEEKREKLKREREKKKQEGVGIIGSFQKFIATIDGTKMSLENVC